MRFKYYLRGCGLGILLAAVILTVAFCRNNSGRMSDEDVMQRASELGMIMPDDLGDNSPVNGTEHLNPTEAGTDAALDPSGQSADPSGTASVASNSENDSEKNNSEKNNSEDGTGKGNSEKNNSEDNAGKGNSEKDNSEKNNSEKNNSEKDNSEKNDSEDEPQKIKVVIKRGEFCREIAEDLYEKGLIPDAEEFRKFMQDNGYDNMILVGEYELTVGMDYQKIAEIITTKPQ